MASAAGRAASATLARSLAVVGAAAAAETSTAETRAAVPAPGQEAQVVVVGGEASSSSSSPSSSSSFSSPSLLNLPSSPSSSFVVDGPSSSGWQLLDANDVAEASAMVGATLGGDSAARKALDVAARLASNPDVQRAFAAEMGLSQTAATPEGGPLREIESEQASLEKLIASLQAENDSLVAANAAAQAALADRAVARETAEREADRLAAHLETQREALGVSLENLGVDADDIAATRLARDDDVVVVDDAVDDDAPDPARDQVLPNGEEAHIDDEAGIEEAKEEEKEEEEEAVDVASVVDDESAPATEAVDVASLESASSSAEDEEQHSKADSEEEEEEEDIDASSQDDATKNDAAIARALAEAEHLYFEALRKQERADAVFARRLADDDLQFKAAPDDDDDDDVEEAEAEEVKPQEDQSILHCALALVGIILVVAATRRFTPSLARRAVALGAAAVAAVAARFQTSH